MPAHVHYTIICGTRGLTKAIVSTIVWLHKLCPLIPHSIQGDKMKKFMRMSDILKQTGLGSTSTVYARIKAGLWTKPIHLSGRASFWLEEEVEALLDAAAAGYDDE